VRVFKPIHDNDGDFDSLLVIENGLHNTLEAVLQSFMRNTDRAMALVRDGLLRFRHSP
jgi:hypothetical protein